MKNLIAKIITIINEKGGVGKTTTTVTVAAGLAHRGYRVLMIDADAQGHATRAFGLAKYPGLYDLLVRDAKLTDVIKPIPAERYGCAGESTLGIIGSNVETRNIANSISDAYAVAKRLAPILGMFDVVLIDTSPTPNLLHGAIYMATDIILYPTLCEFWSFDGLAESMTHLDAAQGMRNIGIGGIIPTRYRAATIEHSENLKSLQQKFGDLVWEPITERIAWAEASTYQVPVFVHDPRCDAAAQAWALVDRVEALIDG
jgi:chromosome partitioning protein